MSRNTPFFGESILLTASIIPKVLICVLSFFLVPRLISPVLSGQNSSPPDTISAEKATRALLDEFTRHSPGREEMISIIDSLQTRTVLDWFTGDYGSASRNDTLQYELGNRFFEETGDSTFLDLAGAGRLRLRTVDLHAMAPGSGVFIEASLFEPLQQVVETYVKYGLIKQEIITNLMIAEFEQAAGRRDYPKYLSLLFESLTLARENGFSTWEAHVLLGIARLFAGISRFEIAQQYYEEAQNVAREIQDPIAAHRAAVGLARTELEIGDPSAAFQQYSELIEQSMRRREREQSFLYRHRGMARLKLKDPEGALKDFLVARAWAEREGWLPALQSTSISIARVHEELGHLNEAREMYLDLLSQDESPCRNPAMWLASYRLGLMAEARGDSSSAVEFSLLSVTCI